MNAYLFTGWVSQFRHGRLVDSCSTLIVCGADGDQAAQQLFEQCLLSPNTAEEPTPTKVEKMVAAPILEPLLGETENGSLDWEKITAQAQRDWEASTVDHSELGYWVDCNESIDAKRLAPDIETLRRGLPPDLRDSLNWAADKTCFFLVSVLSPPPAPAPEAWEHEDAEGGRMNEDEEDVGNLDLVERLAAFPEMAQKERAMVVRARNSVVAAWLWKKHAPVELVGNRIRIDAWCGVIACQGAEPTGGDKTETKPES